MRDFITSCLHGSRFKDNNGTCQANTISLYENSAGKRVSSWPGGEYFSGRILQDYDKIHSPFRWHSSYKGNFNCWLHRPGTFVWCRILVKWSPEADPDLPFTIFKANTTATESGHIASMGQPVFNFGEPDLPRNAGVRWKSSPYRLMMKALLNIIRAEAPADSQHYK